MFRRGIANPQPAFKPKFDGPCEDPLREATKICMETEERNAPPQSGECVRCGVETHDRFGGMWICAECYVTRGSCCPEFGVDDLTDE